MTEKWQHAVSDEKLEEMIRSYCRDYTQEERLGRFDPITGRDKETDEVILILLQKGRKNAVLLAPPGVGKTALVVGLAQQVVKGNVPDYLKDARVLEVDLARMAAGTNNSAEFQERFIPLCKGIAERYHDERYPKTVLFIDEIHQIMPNCQASSYKGLSDVMKPYLTIGNLHVLGATTLDEFRIYMAPDGALERRFQKVFLYPPSVQETYRIMQALRPNYEKHHKVAFSNEMIMLTCALTEEHMRRRYQPDKSIITMDAAMAYHVKEHGTGGEVGQESICYMVGRETGLNKTALFDEKKFRQICEQVAELDRRDAETLERGEEHEHESVQTSDEQEKMAEQLQKQARQNKEEEDRADEQKEEEAQRASLGRK